MSTQRIKYEMLSSARGLRSWKTTQMMQGGPSCLLLGWTDNGRPMHVVVSYPPHVAIITVYEPTSDGWTDLRTRS